MSSLLPFIQDGIVCRFQVVPISNTVLMSIGETEGHQLYTYNSPCTDQQDKTRTHIHCRGMRRRVKQARDFLRDHALTEARILLRLASFLLWRDDDC